MKTLILILLIFSSMLFQAHKGHAAPLPPEGFFCIPSMRETRFQVVVQSDEVQVQVTNPMGYDFMPQFDGPTSIFNLSFNKEQGEDLKDLGDSFTYVWPRQSCSVDSENFTVSCRSVAKKIVKSIQAFGLTTTEVSEKYEGEVYEKRKFRFSLEKTNTYFPVLQFNKQHCSKF